MEAFLNTKYENYEGLSQLLAIPFPLPKAKSSGLFPLSDSSNLNERIKKFSVGFTPFKIPQKLDFFEDLQFKSTSSDVGESSSCELATPFGGHQDKKINSKQGKVKKGPYRKYTLEEKRLAVLQVGYPIIQLNSGRDLKSIAKEFNIPRRNLLRWRKNGCQRKEGGGRPTDFEMESRVYDMIKKNMIATEKEIRQEAKRLSSLKNFKASKGWFVKFCRRFQLKNLDNKENEP